VDREEYLNGFDFHNDLVFHDEIAPESGIDADALIDHRNRLLAHRAKTPSAQLKGQNRLSN
jgi:hypothetical protein